MSSWNKNLYTPSDKNIWQGRADGINGERFYSRVISQDVYTYDPSLSSVAIIGFSCDEGVRRNFGRVGASLGPQKIREEIRSLACHLPSSVRITDLGDVTCKGGDLEEAQTALAHIVEIVRSHGKIPFVLGGGHETAWGHYQGLEKQLGTEKLGIINFDAHFDLRSLDEKNRGSSGTPFYQIAQDCNKKNRDFHYACLGVQEFSNTKTLFERAESLKTLTVLASQLKKENTVSVEKKLENFISQVDQIYLSLCLDVFSSALAPGVSALNPFGLTQDELLPFFKCILQTKKVCGLDIVELSPPWDEGNKTAKLAAYITSFLLHNLLMQIKS